MAAKIYYQEDCNLSLAGRKNNRNYRLWKPGTCTCAESEENPDAMSSSVFMKAASPGQKQKHRDLRYIQLQKRQKKLISS